MNEADHNGQLDPHRDELRRLDLLQRSYADVVAHDHNLDEKFRSLVTALAFLTAAGITLFVFSRGGQAPADLTFDGASWNAANVFFLLFLTSLILSLMSALVGVDPRSFRPSFLVPSSPLTESGQDDAGKTAGGCSIIYATDIAHNENRWKEYSGLPLAGMIPRLRESYVSDTFELARRSCHKERRLGDAQGFIFMAMISLGLLGVVRLPESSVDTRAAGVLLALTLLPIVLAPATLFFMRRDRYIGPLKRNQWFDIMVFYGLPIVAVLFVSARARFWGGSYWLAIGVGLAAVFITSHPSVVLFFDWLQDNNPFHCVVWFVVTVTVIVLSLFNLVRPSPLPIAVRTSYTTQGSGLVYICARVAGQPYDTFRIRAFRDEVLVPGFPRPLVLGATGHAEVSVPYQAGGRKGLNNVRFEFRRRETDVAGSRKVVRGPRQVTAPAAFACPEPRPNRTYVIRRY
jgi:hypothetical protein